LYGNNKHQDQLGCNGTGKLGDSYVCPQPTIGGHLRDQPVQATACGTPVSNMSRLAQAETQAPAQSGGSTKYKCGCNKSAPHQVGAFVTGYFPDVAAAPIGNRPVFAAHDNVSVNTPTEWKGHLLDYKFDCQQPNWSEKCI